MVLFWLGAGLCWALVAFARAVGWVVVWLLRPGCGSEFFFFFFWISKNLMGVSLVFVSSVFVGCFGLLPISYVFRGGAVRYSVPLELGLVYSLVVALCLLVINS